VVTIFDVAQAAGVGIGTVSRVINGSPLVSPATRARVTQAIDQLGYEPSPVARAFGRRRTQQLELLVPLFVEPFFFDLARGIEDALADLEYSLVVRTIADRADRDRVFEECCRRGRADGVLVIWTPPTESFVERVEAEGYPTVLLNATHRRLSSVAVDHDGSASKAVRYCQRIGHRRIALVDRFVDPFASAGPGVCQAGYRDAMDAASLPIPDDYNRVASLDLETAAATLRHLLDLPEPPTAVIVGSDIQATGALVAARAHGRQVPRDLSIVGYNENSVTRFLGLTAVQVPLRSLAHQATQLLLARLADPEAEPREVILPTEVVVRGSCGPPPGH
jgi:LacI family transcriptional regulator/LacI family repressor for deo operon, udp, cdd, tsx, nupC, and nupG